MGTAMTKRERIILLLDHYEDFFRPAAGNPSVSAGDGAVLLLPSMSRHPSVVELCRCLNLLADRGPVQYAHLKAFFTAEHRLVDAPVKRKAKKGTVTVVERRRERVVPGWVRQQKVTRGVDFVAAAFRGEVFLPDQINPWKPEQQYGREAA